MRISFISAERPMFTICPSPTEIAITIIPATETSISAHQQSARRHEHPPKLAKSMLPKIPIMITEDPVDKEVHNVRSLTEDHKKVYSKPHQSAATARIWTHVAEGLGFRAERIWINSREGYGTFFRVPNH